jgi:hypothetical protein
VLRGLGKLTGHTLGEVVEEFIADRKPLADSKHGNRSKRSQVHTPNAAMWLNEFAGTFPGYAVCDLTKEHLNTCLDNFSGKPKNWLSAVCSLILQNLPAHVHGRSGYW